MRIIWVLVLAVVACSGKKEQEGKQPPEQVQPTPTPDAKLAPDAACVDSTNKLKTWLEDLAADGHVNVTVSDITLVKLDRKPSPVPMEPSVVIKPDKLSVDGTPIGDPKKGGAVLAKEYLDRLSASGATGTGALMIVDAKTPWSSLAPIVASTGAARPQVTFVFEAAAQTRATKPPPSPIDAELDELAKPRDPSAPAPKLGDPKDPGVPGKVFVDCPDVGQLMQKLSAMETMEKDRAIIDGMPKAIAACACRVDMPSVQRLMWSWWGRDRGPALAGVTVPIAANGTKVTAKPSATWVDAHKVVLDAVKAGKPLRFQ